MDIVPVRYITKIYGTEDGRGCVKRLFSC